MKIYSPHKRLLSAYGTISAVSDYLPMDVDHSRSLSHHFHRKVYKVFSYQTYVFVRKRNVSVRRFYAPKHNMFSLVTVIKIVHK